MRKQNSIVNIYKKNLKIKLILLINLFENFLIYSIIKAFLLCFEMSIYSYILKITSKNDY